METKILYHGSPNVIRKPAYGLGKPYNDYGLGFYCTEHIELAKEWSCAQNTSGYANKYELNCSGLHFLDLSGKGYGILHWLTILLEHRRIRMTTPVARHGFQWLQHNYHIDLAPYDVIAGYRADDAYFSYARSFLNNAITLEQLSYAMRLGKLGEQFVLKSKKAFNAIKFVSAEKADSDIYHPLRELRDSEARKAFEVELEKSQSGGVYMQTILENNMRKDDARLQ